MRGFPSLTPPPLEFAAVALDVGVAAVAVSSDAPLPRPPPPATERDEDRWYTGGGHVGGLGKPFSFAPLLLLPPLSLPLLQPAEPADCGRDLRGALLDTGRCRNASCWASYASLLFVV